MLGDSSVGKTSILLRFASDIVIFDHMPTIGIDYKVKTLTVEDKKV